MIRASQRIHIRRSDSGDFDDIDSAVSVCIRRGCIITDDQAGSRYGVGDARGALGFLRGKSAASLDYVKGFIIVTPVDS